MLTFCGHDVVEVAQALEVDVHDRDARAEARGHLRRVGAHDAAAEDQDVGRLDAGHAAEQHAAAAVLALEAVRADLDRHAARDLAHGREQRQAAVRLRASRRRSTRCPALSIASVSSARRGEVEVGEDRLIGRGSSRTPAGSGSLTFTIISAAVQTSSARVEHLGAGVGELLVGDAASQARTPLDHDIVAVADESLDAPRDDGDASSRALISFGTPMRMTVSRGPVPLTRGSIGLRRFPCPVRPA